MQTIEIAKPIETAAPLTRSNLIPEFRKVTALLRDPNNPYTLENLQGETFAMARGINILAQRALAPRAKLLVAHIDFHGTTTDANARVALITAQKMRGAFLKGWLTTADMPVELVPYFPVINSSTQYSMDPRKLDRYIKQEPLIEAVHMLGTVNSNDEHMRAYKEYRSKYYQNLKYLLTESIYADMAAALTKLCQIAEPKGTTALIDNQDNKIGYLLKHRTHGIPIANAYLRDIRTAPKAHKVELMEKIEIPDIVMEDDPQNAEAYNNSGCFVLMRPDKVNRDVQEGPLLKKCYEGFEEAVDKILSKMDGDPKKALDAFIADHKKNLTKVNSN